MSQAKLAAARPASSHSGQHGAVLTLPQVEHARVAVGQRCDVGSVVGVGAQRRVPAKSARQIRTREVALSPAASGVASLRPVARQHGEADFVSPLAVVAVPIALPFDSFLHEVQPLEQPDRWRIARIDPRGDAVQASCKQVIHQHAASARRNAATLPGRVQDDADLPLPTGIKGPATDDNSYRC